MAPVYERGALYLGGHFLSTVLLVRLDDLLRFRDWDHCSAIQVEHATHGERILTLMAMAAEYDQQAAAVASRRAARAPIQLRGNHVHPRPGARRPDRGPAGEAGAVGQFESALKQLGISSRQPVKVSYQQSDMHRLAQPLAGGLHDGLGVGRVRVHGVEDLFLGRFELLGHHQFGDQLGRLRADQVGAQELAVLGVEDELDEPLGLVRRRGHGRWPGTGTCRCGPRGPPRCAAFSVRPTLATPGSV